MQLDEKRTPKKGAGEPSKFEKRIGSTVYRVSVHFNEKSTETVEDKILRLLKSEVTKSA